MEKKIRCGGQVLKYLGLWDVRGFWYAWQDSNLRPGKYVQSGMPPFNRISWTYHLHFYTLPSFLLFEFILRCPERRDFRFASTPMNRDLHFVPASWMRGIQI